MKQLAVLSAAVVGLALAEPSAAWAQEFTFKLHHLLSAKARRTPRCWRPGPNRSRRTPVAG